VWGICGTTVGQIWDICGTSISKNRLFVLKKLYGRCFKREVAEGLNILSQPLKKDVNDFPRTVEVENRY
jgi:hypothetical protein